MQETCVQCHNGHDDSTKKDWKVGEVVGVLEIIRPLDRDTARAREGLRFTLIADGGDLRLAAGAVGPGAVHGQPAAGGRRGA